jgi:hypothetical protein
MCARAVDSLLAQTKDMWHCVIAKNGGTEFLGSYVAHLGPRLNDQRIRLLVLPGKGLGYALNQALGPFLPSYRAWANLEDDDEWDPEYLEVMWQHLKSGPDVVHCLQRQEPQAQQSNGGPMDAERIRRQNWINWPMCLFRAKVYRKVGPICEDCGPSTDWDWHLRCTKAGMEYKFIERDLVTHHWHGSNYCLSKRKPHVVPKRLEEGVYD